MSANSKQYMQFSFIGLLICGLLTLGVSVLDKSDQPSRSSITINFDNVDLEKETIQFTWDNKEYIAKRVYDSRRGIIGGFQKIYVWRYADTGEMVSPELRLFLEETFIRKGVVNPKKGLIEKAKGLIFKEDE